MLIWAKKHPKVTFEMLGYIPEFLSDNAPASAKDQIARNYCGGWNAFKGFEMHDNGLKYPGDPLMRLLFETKLRDEVIRFYEASWLAIIQPDGSHEIARLD